MAETSREDKQLPASARRLQKAREEGQVPRSRDFGHFVVLATALGAFIAFGPGLIQALTRMMKTTLRFERIDVLTPQRLPTVLAELSVDALLAVLPLLAAGALAAIAASVVPGGVAISSKPMMPKLSKLNPASGIKRIFSVRNAVDFLKLMIVAGSVFSVGFWYVSTSLPEFASLNSAPLMPNLERAGWLLAAGIASMVGVLVIVAMIDVPFQWFKHRQDLKMTLKEAKDEHKESEGDPHVKGQRRARQREAATRRMLTAVPAADVVVTNPTHFAVAIRYDETRMGAPRVVAKGGDLLAARIREIAKQSNVPLFEAPPLARALYTHVELDQEIPAALYTAVAQVLAYIFQLRSWVPGRGVAPVEPRDIEVPAGMDPNARPENKAARGRGEG